MISSWSMEKSETVVKGYGKEFRKTVFLNPTTGKPEEFYLFGQKDWSVVLPVTKDNMVVAVQQYKQGCNKVILELPAGTADFQKESPEETAQRELLEETGYQAKQIIFLGPPLWMSSRNSWTRFFPFLAIECKKARKAKHDDSEEIEAVLIPLKRWIEMCYAELEEPSAIVATFRGLARLRV